MVRKVDIRLRDWSEDDAPAIVECIDGDPEIARWLDRVPQPYTLEDALAYVRGETTPDEARYCIAAEDGRPLGSIGVHEVEPGVVEIGYWLRAGARGRGAATAALRQAARIACDGGAARVQLRADVENVASCRVAEKAGFTREGVLRSAHWNARLGRRQDWAMYALLAVEYVQPRPRLDGRIDLHDYDPAWPELYAREERRLRSVLGDRVVRVAHTGSTSVPGLCAKPIVDISLEVPDTRDEAAYLPDMEAAGYVLTIREPDWYEHRLFKGPDTNINLHVFPAGCEEFDRMVAFRDHLRSNAPDRALYERTKRELAQRDWEYVQDYADAKTAVVAEIAARATGGS